jgi:hypothetical protein
LMWLHVAGLLSQLLFSPAAAYLDTFALHHNVTATFISIRELNCHLTLTKPPLSSPQTPTLPSRTCTSGDEAAFELQSQPSAAYHNTTSEGLSDVSKIHT